MTYFMTVTSQFTLLTKFTTLELSGEEIKLVLWGSKATQFDIPKDTTSEDKPIIILFTGCLVKLYRGMSISNHSRLFLIVSFMIQYP